MSAAHVQVLGNVVQSGVHTTTVITCSKTVTAGNTIVLAFGCFRANITISGIVDNLGNSYVLGESVNTVQAQAAQLWYAPITVGGTLTTITITHTSEDIWQGAEASEFSGVGTWAAVGGGTTGSSATASLSSKTIPASGLSVWATMCADDRAHAAGAASGSPSTTPVLSYGAWGPPDLSLCYAIAGATDVTSFTGSTTLSATDPWATAGGQFNPAADTSPAWTTPADTVSMSTTPDLKFTSPASATNQHFQLQLDTAATFDTGNLRTLDSSTSQTNWTYWNGSSWVAIPSGGLPIAYAGNEACYTVTSALSGATWYRRVRAGTLV
jgi:hypothetical protein